MPLSTEKHGFGPLAGAGLLFLALFSLPLVRLIAFAATSELYSHILLIPFVSAYFIWLRKDRLVRDRPDLTAAALLLVASLLLLGFYATSRPQIPSDNLYLGAAGAVFFVAAVAAYFFGRAGLRAFAFPLAFLIFIVPLPTAGVANVETALQHGSATVAYWLFGLVRTPVFLQDLVFVLPGFSMEVAPECSGIHSTLALFITSVVASQLFLRSVWARTALVCAVIPLGLLRNGVRIVTVGELCVHIGPEMIESYIHRHGGPVFFAASLVPFGALIWLLSKYDRS